MPYEYHAEVFGNATVRRADLTRVLAYGAAALIGIFLLLQAAAASWRRAGLLLLSLPLSVVGGVLAAPLAGGVWNIAGLAGLFAVLALAIRSAVQLGDRVRAADEAGEVTGSAAVLAAARGRVVPLTQSVLLTAPCSCLLPSGAAGLNSTRWRSPCSAGWEPLVVQVLVPFKIHDRGRPAPVREGPGPIPERTTTHACDRKEAH
jgi:hypothetical protein